MITFFRKLRRQLLSEKKVANYLLYALGEIILVVIGILIALAINNSYNKSQLRKKEDTYLQGLYKEFSTSKEKLETLIKVNRNNLDGARKILLLTENDSLKWNEEKASKLLMNTLAYDIAYNPNNSLLFEMINSGSLKDLSNAQLRLALTNWVSTLEDIAKQEADLETQRKAVLDMIRNEGASLRTILDDTEISASELNLPLKEATNSNKDLIFSMAFENNLLLFMLSARATGSAHYEPLMDSLDSILIMLKNEIEKSN